MEDIIKQKQKEIQKQREGKDWRAFEALFDDVEIYNYSAKEFYNIALDLVLLKESDITPLRLCDMVCTGAQMNDETVILTLTQNHPKLALAYAKHILDEREQPNKKISSTDKK